MALYLHYKGIPGYKVSDERGRAFTVCPTCKHYNYLVSVPGIVVNRSTQRKDKIIFNLTCKNKKCKKSMFVKEKYLTITDNYYFTSCKKCDKKLLFDWGTFPSHLKERIPPPPKNKIKEMRANYCVIL